MDMRLTASTRLPLVLMLALACNSQDPVQPSALTAGPAADASTAPATAAAAATAAESRLPEFEPEDFVRKVTNPLFPLPLGTRLIYRGHEDGLPRTGHHRCDI